jgi:5-(carboxyamino)imidazole ribonucleotide mutase
VKVVIAAAGLAAALPGVVAAYSRLPVIGLPVAAGALKGVDALLAIAQMPPGVPVAAVGIDAGANAAHLALRILGLSSTGE